MSRTIACLTICLLTFISAACERVPLLAPTGSAVTLSINTTTVPANGTAEITAVVIEAGGTAPQNGTHVTFTTTLGSIDPVEAQTRNGRATATFFAGTRSGKASIRAFSGEAETEAVEVFVGGSGAEDILLRIESSTANGTSTVVVARVIDAGGNSIPGAPVSFSSDKGRVTPGSAPTDSNGEARVTVLTSETTVVTATTGGTGDSVLSKTISIGAPGSFILAVTSPAPPAAAEVGQSVTFTITPSAAAFFTDVIVNFGDGSQQNIGAVSGARTFQHTYAARGNYTVTAQASNGASTTTTVAVNDRAPLAITLLAIPTITSISNVTQQGIVTFTATATPSTGAAIESYNWSFGDGGTESTNNNSIPHRYIAPGTYTMSVRVRTTNGQEGTAQTIVRVNP